MARKWLASCASLAPARNSQSRAATPLVNVSWVLNDLEQMMKTVLAYAALLLTSFVLAIVFGSVLVGEIQKVVPAVSSTLNAKQGS